MNRSSGSNSNRVSGSFDVKAHNFGLFSLVKVLSVSSGSKAKPKGKIDANSLNNKQDVTIDVVAQGGYIGHEFLAPYCSNDHFIFRHVGESGVPLVRRLPWLKDPAKKITAMAFNPTAQWLLCVTHDRNIVLIPIYFIMFKSQEANSMMSFNDIKMFSASSKSNAQRHFNHCVWWRPYNSSEDYGIFGSETGSIRIVNLATKERLRLKMKYPISKVEIIEDTTKTSKYLLLNTVGGGYWKLILEQNVGGTSYQSIIKQFNKPPFVLTQINKFGTETALSLQRMHQSEQVIGAYDRSNNKLEIYDALLTKFPLFVFQLFDSEIKDVYLTDKVIFTLRTDEDGWKLGVISRLLSGASANPRWMSKYQKESKLQEFKFGLNERIAGHLPAFVAPKTHVPNSQPSPSLSSPTASMGDQLEFTIIDQTIREQQAAAKSSNGDSMTSEPLEGMFIYTRDSVYEVRPRTPPEQIFFELVQQRSASAEALGKTFALDLLALYEAAADSHIHRGDYGRALDLYYLSNVQTSKLVAKFLEVGRMDVIITRLRSTLGEPTALSMTERRRLSNTLLQCYLQKLLQSKEFQYLDEEFQKFLRKNEDYDANKALALFLEHGLMRYFLLVGDARNLMPRAMQLLATERGSLNIGPEEIKYLTENFLLEHLKSGANGALAKSLPASEQIQLYLADPITVHKYFSRIYSLLPYLTEEVLIQIASYFDPLGENMMKVFSFATSKTAKIMELEVQGGSLNNSSAAVNTNSLNNSSYLSKETVEEEHAATKEEYVELFLSTLFVLNYRRQQRSEPQAKKAKSVQYQMVQSFNEKKVSKVTCGWSHTAVITEDGQVYIWGRNNFSQLGLGHSDHKFTPQKLSSLSHVNITHIACGGEHTIAVDESGTIYAWGANDHGQLGLGDTESRSVPTAITELGQVRVKSLACGWSHSLILTDKGLWVFGAGSQGQLGLGDRDDKHAPHLIAFLEGSKIAQWKAVSCGFHHNALLLDNGNVYTWGSGLYGQLGHGDSEDLLIPRVLSALVGTHFTSVACGSFHTVAVNDLGNIYLWGRAMKKSKVEQERYEDQLEPKLIEFLMGKQASLIATGHFHTVVVSAQGKVYMWGKSFSANKAQKTNDRQRSIAEMFSEVPTPILALKGKRIKQICCGDEFNVVLTERGHVYTWGSGRFGQLGHNSLNDEWAPRLVDSLNEVVNYRVFGNESNTNDKQKNGTEANGAEANGTQKKHLAFDHDEELYGPAMIEATLRGWDAPQVPAGTLNSSNALSASTGPGQHATVPYRPHLVLDKALEWNNFSAASIVALQTRRWLLAVYCTLKSYETMFQTNDEDRTDETLSVLGLLNFIVKDLANVPNREELLYQILQFWHDRKLPLAPLEEHIKDNIRVLSPLLGELLLLQEIPAGSDKSPLCVTFSQDICFAVVTSYTQIMDESFRKEQSEKVPEEKLLASIRNNLNKDVDVKDKIALSTMLAPIKGPTNVNPEDPTHVAFTCGHYFARDDYQDRILPQFKSRAEQLPIAVPVTTKLLLGEYQQRVMNVACPVCVFNYLRVQQTQIDTRAQVEKWEI